jgi:DNA repair exonuclease SbcCD nuclease subunit
MKILHTSNIHLGRSFAGLDGAGDRLRAAIKAAFSRLIDTALAEKAELVILAGDTFDSLEVSQNLLNFFLSQVRRLEKTPVVVLPGARDPYQKGSFWDEWEVFPPSENLLLLTDQQRPYIELSGLSTTVYGYPVLAESPPDNPLDRIKKFGKSSYHIAVIHGNLTHDTAASGHSHPFHTDNLKKAGFDYAALGGQTAFLDFSYIGLKAAYSGSPEILTQDQPNSGQALLVTLDGGAARVEPRKIGTLEWKEAVIAMETIVNLDDLRQRIREQAGPDVILRARLEGLALFEAGLDTEALERELEQSFLCLKIADLARVLPENISEVKVHEKTILGQYLKVMVEKMNQTEGSSREDLDESLKVGYTLLTGKEIW